MWVIDFTLLALGEIHCTILEDNAALDLFMVKGLITDDG